MGEKRKKYQKKIFIREIKKFRMGWFGRSEKAEPPPKSEEMGFGSRSRGFEDKFDSGENTSHAPPMSSYQPQSVDPGVGLGCGLGGEPSVGEAMKQVKAMLKQQLDQQHYAALMAGIQMNCMKACDNNARSTLDKKCIETCAERYQDAWNIVAKAVNQHSK